MRCSRQVALPIASRCQRSVSESLKLTLTTMAMAAAAMAMSAAGCVSGSAGAGSTGARGGSCRGGRGPGPPRGVAGWSRRVGEGIGCRLADGAAPRLAAAIPPKNRARRGERPASLLRCCAPLGRLADSQRLQALRPAADFQLDRVALGEGLVLIALDRGEVDEHVLAAALGDEAEAFRRIEPFHGATNHSSTPFEAGVFETPQDAVPTRGRLRPADLAGTSEPRRDDKQKPPGRTQRLGTLVQTSTRQPNGSLEPEGAREIQRISEPRPAVNLGGLRSEERRVGKECR